jgi:hypothetical protein
MFNTLPVVMGCRPGDNLLSSSFLNIMYVLVFHRVIYLVSKYSVKHPNYLITFIYTVRQKLSTTWLVSIIFFSNNELISNRFAVFVTCTHILTYLANRLLVDFYLCVYDRVCKVPRVLFNICICERKLIVFV